jgi:hypothetical protein
VIYYFHNMEVPLFLMVIYAKTVQADLSMKQRRALSAQLRARKRDWKEKKTKLGKRAGGRLRRNPLWEPNCSEARSRRAIG